MGKHFRFNHVVVAGTFDHLHKGHTYLLDQAFLYGRRVSIGVTSDSFITQKLFSDSIETFSMRLNAVQDYVAARKLATRASYFKLDDIYGPAAYDSTMQAILVTQQTRHNAVKLNRLRKQKKLPVLHIVGIPLQKGSDSRTISSSRLRKGEIDKLGYVYSHIYRKTPYLTLPTHLRVQLRHPVGEVYEGKENALQVVAQRIIRVIKKKSPVMVVTVGDIVSHSLKVGGYTPDLTIIDLKTQRHTVTDWHDKQADLHINKPGTISRSSSEAIRMAIHDINKHKIKKIIRIRGEEDLLTIAAILHAPLGSLVLYGQRNLGAVAVWVTDGKKSQIVNLLSKFIR